ncbi:PAS domain-containing protein [Rubellimicrobium mesophilum]|uniref:PAS domain-containing protein n=1 Tax=Rubellimicrobium mesophilum TaxID=1123067 RepID=UPI0012E32CCD|nr:PAS domain-containing protein [Rubellimicrobium mesophilum]
MVQQGSDWPQGGGEMGARIRAFDWASTQLGPIQDWPDGLRAVVALMLATPQPACLCWGRDAVPLYNDGYVPILGSRHPGALGRAGREAWAEVPDEFGPALQAAFEGKATVIEDRPVPDRGRPDHPTRWFTFSWTPLRGGDGTVEGAFGLATETFGHALAARRREERQAFLLGLSNALRPLADSVAIQGEACRLLAERLDVERAYYVEVDEESGIARVERDHVRDGGISLAGEHRIADFGWSVAILRRGDCHVIRDVRSSPLVPPADRPASAALRIVACMGAPLVKAGRLVGALCVTEPEPRDWTEGEVELLREVGEHIWAAVERARAEAALRESEARSRSLFEAVDAGVCVVEVDLEAGEGRADYRVVEANPAFYGQTGFPASILGLWLREAAPALEEHWYEIYGRVARSGEPARFEQGSDLLGRWFDVHAFRVDAERRRVAILFNDISARRRAELEVQALNADLEARVAERTAERDRVWQLSRDLLVVVGADGIFRAVNPAWTAILGHDPEDVVGHSFRDFIWPEDAELTQSGLDEAAAARDLTSFENRYRHRDGSPRWISWHTSVEDDLVYAYGRDITADKERQARLERAEAARREAYGLYRAYFDNTAEALFVIGVLPDGGFTIEELNPAHQAATGLDLRAVRGRRVEEQLPPPIAQRVIANYRSAVELGRPVAYREVLDLPGGTRHWDTILVPVRVEDGRVTRIVGSSRDVTARVQAEDALRQSQKMEGMGQLTGGVAHDFNNLLTPILGALDRLQRRGLGTERDQRLVEGALQSAERARTLVQRLLAFARRQPLQARAVDVGELVRGMADLVASTTGPQIRVSVETAPDLPFARADANQLEMAVLNLAVNARDAMPERGTLRITANGETVGARHPSGAAPGRYLRLSVADTGTGMDEATLARAVEPFYSTKGLGRGTGLGLSMVHGLAAQLGGALTIRSRPGLGTNVELWLPVAEDGGIAEAGPPDDPREAAVPGNGTVLLVDDEDLVRATAADMLADLGYGVVEASSAEEALRRLEAGPPPDLLLTDHLMPGLTGTELARIARSRDPGLPVLVISGYADAEGIDPDLPRLAKPYRRSDLAASLAGLVRPAAPPR